MRKFIATIPGNRGIGRVAGKVAVALRAAAGAVVGTAKVDTARIG